MRTLWVGAPACPSALAAKQTTAPTELTTKSVRFTPTPNDLSVSHALRENRGQSVGIPPENAYEVALASARAHRRGRSHPALPVPRHRCRAPSDQASDSLSNTWRRTNPAPIQLHYRAYRRGPKHW